MERRNVSIHQGTALSLAADPYTSPSFTPAGPCRTYPPTPSEQLMIFYWFVGDARFRVDAEGEGSQSFPLEGGEGQGPKPPLIMRNNRLLPGVVHGVGTKLNA
ncbi:hypothetical protein AVEN_185670-1 [Araneus ventricosus]|uniref:Uncharacterized protein n=1 Tax=Araneus ventricosus TaxID=182803 RepID=A0A4Y2RRB9_ARAVE|nr:hypothetical protein AVEN_124616-1 [Araneus ventricosus]GBN78357.1 hypothetical protein AVEN_93258-1 [Araneus ventricosus]GBN78482.1 hypothetical protein AVEN_102894-1 [Araneus ventricosus]GBN78520.1 hypothetical protein AVEN_101459-1 [Araneus ventricosus]GBN91282.1 hypothetical protein AVEN_185670-1 [Araneus ventricosus]